MRICPTDDTSVLNIEGVEYLANKDGSFDVPEELGVALVAFPHWQREHEALDAALEAKAERDSDGALLGARVEVLEARVAELEAENTKLKKASGPAKAAAPAKAGPAAARKAPAKKAAASKSSR